MPESLARLVGCGVESVYRAGVIPKVRALSSTPPITSDKVDTLCMHRGFSSAKATRLLGYTPCVGYEEGVAQTIEWMVSTRRLSVSPISETR
jgi:nucleoside-diphosphate-sugar epimerase